MLDIKVDNDNDIVITEDGDFLIEENDISQAIKIRLRWIAGEWRLGPSLGFPAFEDLFVKNPNLNIIMSDIREAVMDVDGVEECSVEVIDFDRRLRTAVFKYTAVVNGETITEEVTLNA